MGYYFKFEIHCTLKRDTPQEVLDTIFHEIYSAYVVDWPDSFSQMVPDSLKEFYRERAITAKPDHSHEFWKVKRATDIFSWYNGETWPQIIPRWEDHYRFKEDTANYKPFWHLRLVGDLNYGYDAINAFVGYIAPHLAGHRPKQYIGWYKGEDQNQRINLYASKG